MSRLVVGRSDGPRASYEIREAVELWARKAGRHAKLEFAPGIGWFVKLTLRSNDKSLEAFQKQKQGEEPVEMVFFHVPNPRVGQIVNGQRQGPYVPLNIEDMGASGVTEFLEKGDTWSGRGQFSSLTEAVRHASEQNRANEARIRSEAKANAREIAADQRRSRLKIPFLGVSIDLRSTEKATASKESE